MLKLGKMYFKAMYVMRDISVEKCEKPHNDNEGC